jgi:hypothetical protein
VNQTEVDSGDWCLLLGDSHTKSVQCRRIEEVLKGNCLQNPAYHNPKEGSAYTTSRTYSLAMLVV